MTSIPINEVVFDEAIYPRVEWSQETVVRYVEALNAGDVFPPITLELNTNRLLDGMHRLQTHKQAQRNEIEVTYLEIPDDVPPKLFAASLSVKHGDRISNDDLKTIAREITTENPDYNLATISQYTGVTRQTISKWVSDITEHRKVIRRLKVLLYSRAGGWSKRQIAKELNIDEGTVRSDVKADIIPHLTEGNLKEAASDLPPEINVDKIIEDIRQELIFATFSDIERKLVEKVRNGETVIVSLRGGYQKLIEWANGAGLYVRIDRRSKWGNPFETPDDGDRDTVIKNYAEHYIPYKPSLLSNLDYLMGKVLGCWCAPLPCHGDVLKGMVENGEIFNAR